MVSSCTPSFWGLKNPWIATVQHSTFNCSSRHVCPIPFSGTPPAVCTKMSFVNLGVPSVPAQELTAEFIHRHVCAICGFVKSGKKSPLFNGKIHLQMVNVPLKCQFTVYTPILMSLLHIWGMYIMRIMYTICILLIHPLLSAHSLYPYCSMVR